MRRRWIRGWRAGFVRVLFCVGSMALLLTCLFAVRASAHAYLPISLTPTPVPTPSPDAQLGYNGNLLVALATFGGAVVAALIAGIFIMYQLRRQRTLERENQRIARENQEMQRRLEQADQRQQFEGELEKSQYEAWLVARREAQERERERKLRTRAAARAAMVQAQTPAERSAAYRRALHEDPNIAQLQILDMAHPMDVAKVYVRLRVHQEAKLGYEMEPSLWDAETRGDPNALLKARFSFLEQRSQAALTPEEALQKYPRCVVLGDPGAGKSTLLKYLTLQAIDGCLPHLPHFPIHIVLGSFAASTHQDLLSFAAEHWDEWYGFPEEEARALMESRLDDGSALLLLDALDETVIGGSDELARDSYRRVLDAIERLATRYSKAPIIVTARKAGYDKRVPLKGFTRLDILDFGPAEIKEFVGNWFRYHPAPPKHATAEALQAQLTRHPRMQALATNPLLLCLIVMVYEAHQELPEQRTELYKRCVDTLLSRWDTSRDIRRRRKFNEGHKQKLLIEIAGHFHLQGRRYFPQDELLRLIANFLPTIQLSEEDSSAILSEIEEENGLLKEQAHGWHGFLHLTLQEYFAAHYLEKLPQGLNELLAHCGDPWWEEVMLLYAGSVYDASPLLRSLLGREQHQWFWQDVFHTSLLWAGQCLSARPRIVDPTIRQEILACLFTLLEQTRYLLTEDQIVTILLRIEGNDARGKLLLFLKERRGDQSIRQAIVRIVGETGDHRVVGELVTVLKDRQDKAVVRERAAHALGQLGERSVVGELVAVLKDRQDDAGVRWRAAYALGRLGERSVVGELVALLKDRQDDAAVRRWAADALGQLGERSGVGELVAVLKDRRNDADVRRSAADALARLGERSGVGELVAVLKDRRKDIWVRKSAARALGRLGDHSVLGELVTVLKDRQDDADVRIAVLEALAALGEHEVVGSYLHLFVKRIASEYYSFDVIESLIGNEAAICAFAQSLKPTSQNEDNIHEALWNACQREKVRILVFTWWRFRFVRVVKQE